VSRIEKLEKLSENTPGYTSTLTAYILLPGMFYGSEECFRFIGADTFFLGGISTELNGVFYGHLVERPRSEKIPPISTT